ncbi:MAG: hypothetical protein K2M87_03415, partial [Muribaculaceae bacterium]|nr:hypothetical protein [Muribaculaceae bacterium]
MKFATSIHNGRPDTDNDIRTAAELGVYDFLDKQGVSYTTLCHPEAFTMEECESVRAEIGAPVFKNLFLTNRQQTDFYL